MFLSCFLILSQSVCAAAIKVEGDAPLKSIAVTIENATVNNVVLHLSQQYGFEVKGSEMLNDVEPFSARVSGSLRSVLEQLLRYCNNCSYIILPGASNQIGVEKLIILKSPHGPGTPQDLKTNPAQSASPLFGLGR
jgi:hypothetical protein